MSKRETRLLALACTFIGIVLGFLIAPIKAGTTVSCGNNRFVPHKSGQENRCKKRHAGPVPLSSQEDRPI